MSDKPWLTQAYRDHLASPEWAQIRREALLREPQCPRCGAGWDLDVHHLHYRTLGHESLNDVMVLCRRCHDAEHKRQDYDRRLSAWATKRYGEYWYEMDGERIDDEFARFLDRIEQ